MDPASSEFNPHSIETDVTALWKSRRLPPAGGVLGPPSGPAVRQFEGSWTLGDFPALVADRAIAADVDARYLLLTGRRVSGTLRQGTGAPSPSTIPALLTALGVWVGGDGRTPWDAEARPVQVQAMVGRLAAKGILVTRDEAFRICPSCGTLRSPERLVYDEQEGDTYLVRFPVRVGDRNVNALVWVDAPWKLLGASALLLNPNLRYVVAGYRRRDDRELILTSASSIDRLRAWIPDSVLEVVEERAGREFQGIAYTYPLRHEFPMGGDLAPPAGTLLGAADVGDSGTGIVPLVPGHGATDARIAERVGVSGWPLLTPKGRLDFTLMHKYAGLDLDTANEFVLRDLSEAGALLALLRVKRGVPYCSICGTALLWAPARAWCLEPSRLAPERRALFSRLLPGEELPGQAEVAPWPVSEAGLSDDASAVSLLECARCDRLDGPEGPKQCPCGGQRTVVRRKILPSIGAALAAWARLDPFPEGDSAHLYVGQRRRVPSLLHHLAALSAVEGSVAEVSLTVVPTASSMDLADLVGTFGADAVRAAVVRSGVSAACGGCSSDRCRRESDRLRRWWTMAREVAARLESPMVAEFARPVSGFLGDLEAEDRAILARWERTRVLALAHYDRSAPGLAYRRVARFLDNDLVEYRELVEPRLTQNGAPATKRAALRTLVHLLRGVAEVLAPVVPFTAEAVHRSLSPHRMSLFERPIAGLDRSLVNDELVAAWDRWRSVLRSVDRFRRSYGIPRSTLLPSLVLVVPADDVGDRFRSEREVLARLVRVQRLEVGSPREPWGGRQRVLYPVEAEIQKVYPTQASQIIHILQRMPPRRGTGASGEEELGVVIDGYLVRIFPAMVSIVETLPKQVVAVPWPVGEMYVELPPDVDAGRVSMPPLSSDAFWLVRRLHRRLRAAPASPDLPPRVAIATVKDPLASELRTVATPVARSVGLRELRVVEKAEEAVPPNAVTGRTRTGDRWWVHVPGLPSPRPRTKRPRHGTRLARISSPPPSGPTVEVDYADEKEVARAEAVRVFGQELDDIVGLPLLGPSKIASAWDRGLHTVDDLRRAPFEVVSALPGFGGPIAEVVVTKLGGAVPPRDAQARRRPGETERVSSRARPIRPPSRPSAPVAIPSPTRSGEAPAPFVSERPPPAPVSVPPPSPVPAASLVAPPAVEPPPTETLPPTPPAAPEPEGPEAVAGVLAPSPAEPVPEPPVQVEAEAPRVGDLATQEPTVPAMEAALPAGEMPPLEPTTPPPSETPVAEATGPTIAPGEPELSTSVEENVLPPGEPAEAPAVTEPPEGSPVLSTEGTEPLLEEVPMAPPPETPTAEPSEAPAEVPEIAETPSFGLPPEATTPVPLPEEEPEGLPDVREKEAIPEPAAVPLAPESEPAREAVSAPTPPPEELPPTPAEAVLEPAPPPAGLEAPKPSEPLETPVAAEALPAENLPVVPPELSEPTPSSTEATPTLSVPEPSPEVPPPPTLEPPSSRVPEPPEAEAPNPVVSELSLPPVPAAVATEPEPPLPPSGVELTVGDSLFTAIGGFLDSTSAGHRGICVVREPPERIRSRVGSRPIEVFWLSNIGRGPSLRPSDLEGMWAFLGRKLVEEHATAFFLEGIEYLVRIHGAEAVLTGLVQFDRLARENDARVWVYLTPALMKPGDIERFRATFEPGPSVS